MGTFTVPEEWTDKNSPLGDKPCSIHLPILNFQCLLDLRQLLKKIAKGLGADCFGVANLSPAQEVIEKLWEKETAQFPRAISFGVALPHDIVNQQPTRFSSNVAHNYKHHAYNIINQRLDHIASRLSSVIQRGGNRSLPIPATQEVIYNEELYGIFSHKMAARFSGLGWIGKCCLMVTPEVGPRVRWSSVLTDAPLKFNKKPMHFFGTLGIPQCPAVRRPHNERRNGLQ